MIGYVVLGMGLGWVVGVVVMIKLDVRRIRREDEASWYRQMHPRPPGRSRRVWWWL